jgi:hypothetical protein
VPAWSSSHWLMVVYARKGNAGSSGYTKRAYRSSVVASGNFFQNEREGTLLQLASNLHLTYRDAPAKTSGTHSAWNTAIKKGKRCGRS